MQTKEVSAFDIYRGGEDFTSDNFLEKPVSYTEIQKKETPLCLVST